MITIPRYDPVYNVDLEFDGKLNNLTIGQVNNLTLTAFTVEFWIKASKGNTGTFLSYTMQSGIKQFYIENVNNLNIWLNNLQTTPTGVSIADDVWHFVAITWQSVGGPMAIWIDGMQKWSGVLAPGSSIVTGGKMVFAQSQSAQGFDPAGAMKGKLFNFRFWNQARTSFFSNQGMNRTIPESATTVRWQQNGYVTDGARLAFKLTAPVSESAVFSLDANGLIRASVNFGKTFSLGSPAQPVPFKQLAAAADWQFGTVDPSGTILVGIGRDSFLYAKVSLDSAWVQIPGSNAVIGVAVMRNGTMLGVGTDNFLYTRSALNGAWTQVANSGSVIAITIMPDGSILGVNRDNLLYTRATLTANWVQVPNSGAMIAVSVMPNGTILGVGTDKFLYSRSTLNSSWVKAPNNGSVIAVTAQPDGSIIGVGSDNTLYTRATLSDPWVQVPNSGTVTVIGVLSMSLQNVMQAPQGSTIYVSKNGAAWNQPSPSAALVQASVQTGGTGIGVNGTNQVLTISNYGTSYTNIPGVSLTWVSVSGTTAWGVGVDKKLYRSSNSGSSGWAPISNMPSWEPLQVDVLGSWVVVLTTSGQLFYTLDNGNTWVPILTSYPTFFTNMQLMANTLWAINSYGQLLFAELNTKMIINLMCEEGYGDGAFDTSGNKNNAVLGGGIDGGKPTWEISTQLAPPGFINDLMSTPEPPQQTIESTAPAPTVIEARPDVRLSTTERATAPKVTGTRTRKK